MEYCTLSNGVQMPMLGYGTLQISPKMIENCVLHALKSGYRLIDTAAAYFNEEGIGKAIQGSGIDREEIFITSKVWIQDAGFENTLQAFERTCQRLQVDYLDLYLIHQPYGDYYGAWKAMEVLYQQGKIRALGVCNFSAERFVDLCLNSAIKPMINQIEFHPFFQQFEVATILKKYDCKVQAWGPLAEGQRNIFDNGILKGIANKHHKTVSQVILRWHMQNHVIAIPKTIHSNRMKENIDIFDFLLDEQDIRNITALDIGYSEIINHQSYTTAKWLNMYKIHE